MKTFMPRKMQLYTEKPKEKEVEGYFLLDENYNTAYAYWKLSYEKVTEELLSKNYKIHNVTLSNKGNLHDNMITSDCSYKNLPEEFKKPELTRDNELIGYEF